ncbi:helix-turn-helix domain-containing protein [Pantoea tagorei]
MIEFMKHHLDSPAPLAEVAEFVGVTVRQLNLIFARCTGYTAAVYWRRMRLEQARKLMADSSNSLNAIAGATGFADASHLIAWFRKQYGETPSSFRKRRREVERLIKE